MSKVIVGLSTSIDGIARGTGEHDFMAVLAAARRTTSLPGKRHLERKAAALSSA